MLARRSLSSVCLASFLAHAAHASGGSIPQVPPGHTLTRVATGFTFVEDLLVDPFGRLLVVDGGLPGPALDGRVVHVRDDGTQVVLSSGYHNPRGIAVNGDGALYVCDLGPTSVTGDRDGVLWKDAGAGPFALVTELTSPDDLIFDPASPTDLLMSEVSTTAPFLPGETAVFRVDSVSGAISTYFEDGQFGLENIRGLAVDTTTFPAEELVLAADNDSDNLFWLLPPGTRLPVLTGPFVNGPWKVTILSTGQPVFTDATRSNVYLVPTVPGVPGQPPVPLIRNVAPRGAVFAEGRALYFSDGGTVWKTTPPVPLPPVVRTVPAPPVPRSE